MSRHDSLQKLFPQGVSKVVLHARLNVFRESPGDS